MGVKEFAERLSRAAPGRFEFTESAYGNWVIEPIRTPTVKYWIKLWNGAGTEHAWAFWGPLWDECNITYFGHGDTWLERVADAVCRSFEEKQ